MNATRIPWFLSTSLVVCASASFGQQLCLEPSSGFHVDGIVGGSPSPLSPALLRAIAGFDDGSGPALFVGGQEFATAGTELSASLARWDGVQWSDTGVTIEIEDLVVYGGALYVRAESEPALSTWNGTGLTPLADQPNGDILSFDVIDLGSGPEIYISGPFTQIGATSVQGIARFDGSTWSAVPNGALVRGPFEAFDDGMGLALYGFSYTGGNCSPALARLDGGVWTSVGSFSPHGSCLGLQFYDLQTHDDGVAPALYVIGNFATAGGVNANDLVRFDGSTWSEVRNGLSSNSNPAKLFRFDDGGGPSLFLCGDITITSGPGYGVARWNGSTWVSVGSGGLGHAQWTVSGTRTEVQALGVFDDGSGPRLVASGTFESAGPIAAWGVARWNGVAWSNFGSSGQGIGLVSCLAYLDDGSGPAMYVGGEFAGAGTIRANNIARWTGSGWAALGGGMNHAVHDLEVFNDGSGLKLYAAGQFSEAEGVPANGVARWNGTQWSPFGTQLPSEVHDLLVVGNRLYAGLTSTGLRRWDGTTWTNLGGPNGPIFALEFYNGFIYAIGQFTQVDGIPASGIARYDPGFDVWSVAGTTVPGGGFDLIVHDDGTGPALWVAKSGGPKRLQGNTWTTPPFVDAREFASVDFGLGRPTLVACSGSGVGLRSWTGTGWLDMTTDEIDHDVTAIVAIPSSSSCAPDIFVGGRFTRWDDVISTHIQKLTLCGEPSIAYCFGDGSLATQCPCVPPNTVPNPSGASGHGCANSFNLDGAKLCAVGTTSPDTVTLRANGLTPIGFTQFFKGNAQNGNGVAYADGVRCVDGAILRFGGQNAVLGTAYYPNPALGLNAPLSNAGTPPGSGLTGHYQAIYRNAAVNFCTIDTLNITNAVSITWN